MRRHRLSRQQARRCHSRAKRQAARRSHRRLGRPRCRLARSKPTRLRLPAAAWMPHALRGGQRLVGTGLRDEPAQQQQRLEGTHRLATVRINIPRHLYFSAPNSYPVSRREQARLQLGHLRSVERRRVGMQTHRRRRGLRRRELRRKRRPGRVPERLLDDAQVGDVDLLPLRTVVRASDSSPGAQSDVRLLQGGRASPRLSHAEADDDPGGSVAWHRLHLRGCDLIRLLRPRSARNRHADVPI